MLVKSSLAGSCQFPCDPDSGDCCIISLMNHVGHTEDVINCSPNQSGTYTLVNTGIGCTASGILNEGDTCNVGTASVPTNNQNGGTVVVQGVTWNNCGDGDFITGEFNTPDVNG